MPFLSLVSVKGPREGSHRDAPSLISVSPGGLMSHCGTLLLFRSRAGVGGNGGECVSCICLAKVPSHAGALP